MIQSTISSDITNSIFEENNNTLWIGTIRGINKFDKKNKIFTRYYFDKKNLNAPVNRMLYGITQLPGFQGVLWITSNNGLVKFNTKTEEMQQILFENPDGSNNDALNQLIKLYYFPTYPSKLWLASFGGLIIYDIYSGESKIYQHEKNNPNSLSASWTLSVQEDQDGNIWVGTYGGGSE